MRERDAWRRARIFALGVAITVTALAPARALVAQISPGPLARAHAALDVQLGCAKCHGGGKREGTTPKCLACHREIASLQQQNRGFHARGTARTATCASCHPDHAGRDFAVIEWPGGSRERFDHATAGYTLEGKHRDVACGDCHQESFRVDASAALSPRKGGPQWAGLQQRCASCHEDPHRPTLGATCTSCHDMAGWKPASGFDHERTDYPLTGDHADVKCAACHLADRLRPRRNTKGDLVPVFKPVPAASCSSCHADPHRTPSMARCASCHVTSGFRSIKRGAFAHDRTRFPLAGEHGDVPCASCHAGYPRTIDRPAFGTCATCHMDPHRGQATLAGRPADCVACHRVQGFAPATFTVAQHQATAYPLLGGHATARCVDCHRPRDVAPPNATERPARRPAPAATTRRIADLRPAASACTSCHLNPHQPGTAAGAGGGQSTSAMTGAGASCESCHDLQAFRPSTLDVTSHKRFSFTLEGAHRTVPCAECHKQLNAKNAPWRATTLLHAASGRALPALTLRAPTTCAGCHLTPHGKQFDARRDRGACESCHTVAAFRPAERFDHDRDSKFRLAPAHSRVPCASCHAVPSRKSNPVTYRGTVVKCSQCHAGGKR